MAKQSIIINGADNVAVALTDLKAGEEHEGVTLADDIVKGHKFSLCTIAEGEQIIKYGNSIACATQDIPAGTHVHTHNARTNLSENLEYTYTPVPTELKEVAPRTVRVYKRANGDVGIRNELWIIPTVGCVNGQAKLILETFKNRYGTSGYDGVFAYTATTIAEPDTYCRRWFATPTRAACSCSGSAVKIIIRTRSAVLWATTTKGG